MKILLYVTTIFLFLSFTVQAQEVNASPLVINEFMADPDGTDSKYEWIELYNSSETSIQLSEWTLDGTRLSASVVEPNSYAIVARSKIDFVSRYGEFSNLVQHNFSLSNTLDTITLSHTAYSDIVEYSSVATEKSSERACTDNSFTVNDLGNSAGRINNVCIDLSLELLREGEWTNNLSGFKNDKVRIKTKETFEKYEWMIGSYTSTGSVVELDLNLIGKQDINLTVTKENNTIDLSEVIEVFPRVTFSEIFANPEGADSGKEWIELYNSSNLELQEWILKDLTTEETIDISNEEYFLIYPQTVTLNNSGESLQLVTPTGLISDWVEIPKVGDDISYSLINDKWSMDYTKSPGENNAVSKLIVKELKTSSQKSVKSKSYSKPSPVKSKPVTLYPENIVLVDQESIDEEIDVEDNNEIIIGNLLLIVSGLGTLIRRYLHL